MPAGADNLDQASELEEQQRLRAMAVRRPEGPEPTGWCLYCDELVADHQRWCDAHCRGEWEREQERLRGRG